MRKRGERSYLRKQQHWLFSLFIQLLNTSPQETRPVARAGGVSGPAGHRPRSPSTLQFTAHGWIQTTKNGSSERGARANCPAETCLRARNYHRPLHPRSYFGAATGHPCAHPRTLPGLTHPACWGRCSHAPFARPCVLEKPSGATCLSHCPQGPRGLHFGLWLPPRL